MLQNINYGTAYEHIRLINSGTACHARETSAGFFNEIEYFESKALKTFSFASVSLSTLKSENETCNSITEPFRCAIFSSILDYGSVFWYNFPLDMEEFE
ncbi:MAG: hypothetical protein HRU38_05175 [Saccharospirillaceae bacterium]|nr:hypothetical protein [Saccharospirillaceae bacterium]